MKILNLILVMIVGSIGAYDNAFAQMNPLFREYGRFRGVGLQVRTLIADGPSTGVSRLYVSYIYPGSTLDIVAVDPTSGKTDIFSPSQGGEMGAWAMAEGGDGQIYIGTVPKAHIMRVDWEQMRIVDLGVPSSSETYIWDLTLANDKKLYGVTYPNAKLISFDPATSESNDLGRMSNTEQYARSVASDAKGFVYVGIGMVKADLVAYEIATGRHQSILPAGRPISGAVQVVKGDDDAVYTQLNGNWFRLDGWQAVLSSKPKSKPLQLKDGRVISFNGEKISLPGNNNTVDEYSANYKGKEQTIFRIGLGPDGEIYGSTVMPARFFSADLSRKRLEEIGVAGAGEYYSFLAWKDRLLGAVYSGKSPVTSFIPGRKWEPGSKKENNPWGIHFNQENSGWRPMAMIAGFDEKVYIGALSGYGLLGGLLCVFDPETGRIEQYTNLIQNHGIYALAALSDGLIVGGTTINGGGGTRPVETAAKIFLWNSQKREIYFELVPVPNQSTIDALAVAKSGLVYGFAGPVMFVFDPVLKEIKKIYIMPAEIGTVIYNAVSQGPQQKIYGLSTKGIFTINESLQTVQLLASYPGGITSGFAIRKNEIFFTQGAKLISYELPSALIENQDRRSEK